MAVRYYDRSKEQAFGGQQKKFDLVGPTQWLKGEQQKLEMPAEKAPAPGTQRHYISRQRAAFLTDGFLGLVANEAYTWFSEGMPRQYNLDHYRYIDLVDNYPHLGYCGFAAIPIRKPDGAKYVVRLHFANFNARIDTTPGAKFFDIKSINRGAMFFGVAFSQDEKGAAVIDRSVHHSGIAFITPEPSQALDYAIHMRTGVNADKWRQMAAAQNAGGKRAA
jgi:hypothetical protein